MAFRRCIRERAKLLYQQQRFSPSFSYIIHKDDTNNTNVQSPKYPSSGTLCFGNIGRSNIHIGGQGFYSPFPPFPGRNMSTTAGGGPAEKGEMLIDGDVFLDGALETATAQLAPAVSEVAVAAADSFLPIASLQYLIDYVHVSTGFNWWASIVVTTFIIRLLTTPLMINQLKATSKFTLLRPKLEAVKQEMQANGMSPAAVSEGQAKMKELFKEHKVTPFTPLKGMLIQGPLFICFFLAIKNMAEKIPSFQHGGAYWFVDLTTPDTTYLLPVLTALTFWITVEFNMQDGMEGNPAAKTVKNVSRVFAALTVPFTAGFAKAIFCYWISANVFSLMYGVVIKNPKVKELLGIPKVPVTPPSPNSAPSGLSFTDAIKKYAAARAFEHKNVIIQEAEQRALASVDAEASKDTNQKIPSSAILSQRIRSLEKEVKGRKKGGKKK